MCAQKLIFVLTLVPHPCCVFPLQSLGNSQREYEKHVLLYSIRNQLRFRNNLGEQTCPSHLCQMYTLYCGHIMLKYDIKGLH